MDIVLVLLPLGIDIFKDIYPICCGAIKLKYKKKSIKEWEKMEKTLHNIEVWHAEYTPHISKYDIHKHYTENCLHLIK